MRQALSIALLQFRLTYKSTGTVLAFLGLPVLMTLVFGLATAGVSGGGGQVQHIPTAVVDQDGTYASRRLVTALQGEQLLAVRVAAAAELPRLFADKKVVTGVIIPAGYQAAVADAKAPELQVVSAPGGGNQQWAVAPAVTRLAARVGEDYRLAHGTAGGPPDVAAMDQALRKVQADRQAVGAEVVTAVGGKPAVQRSTASIMSETALGFTVMFVMMLVFMQGGTILQERQKGTWGRLLTTPASPAAVLGGYLLSFFVIGMMQFGLLVGITWLIFRSSWGPLPQLFTVAAALVLCSAGIGFFVAGLVRTVEQQRIFGAIFVTATSMLGGVYWPLEMVGETMRRIGYLTPQAWAMEGLRDVMLRGGAWSGLTWPLLVLVGLTVVFMGAGLFRVRFE